MRRVTCLLIPFLAFVASACGSSPTSPSTSISTAAPQPKNASGIVTAMIDGVSFTALSTQVSTNGGAIALAFVGVADNTLTGLGWGVTASAPGTYAIPSGANNALLQYFTPAGVSTAAWTATNAQGSGTITITSLTANSATGTFTLTVLPASNPGPAGTGTKAITAGTFNITF